MSSTRKKQLSDESKGPIAYENWLAFRRKKRGDNIFEVPLYSDTHITGDFNNADCPYQLLNTIAGSDDGRCRRVLLLRSHDLFAGKVDVLHKINTDTSRFHGGGIIEEVSALLSLELGVRLRASSTTRLYFGKKDKVGRPLNESASSVPILVPHNTGRTMPRVRSVSLQPKLFLSYPDLAPDAAVAVARAARIYQNALWISDMDPANAWLMFTSPIEVAASFWRTAEDSPENVFRRLKPSWTNELEEHGGDELVKSMAVKWEKLIGATNRFLKFSMNFLPPSPTKRPPAAFRVKWSKRNLREVLDKIYGYRSDSLHGGIPFPSPMCFPPYKDSQWDAPTERPTGLAASAAGGAWTAEDMPMCLHVFEYIVRGALLRWWAKLIEDHPRNGTHVKG